MFACPLLLHAKPFGVLSAYRAATGPLSPTPDGQMRRYTHAVTRILLQDAHSNSDGALEFALPHPAGRVQQDVGVVMQYAGTALHRLRAYAHSSARPMHDVVADVRNNRIPFDPTAVT